MCVLGLPELDDLEVVVSVVFIVPKETVHIHNVAVVVADQS